MLPKWSRYSETQGEVTEDVLNENMCESAASSECLLIKYAAAC
jgi:hypothetical protein